MENKLPLRLLFVTPNSPAEEVFCDLVTFFTIDNAYGEGGGSMGVRKGHIKCVAALSKGDVTAYGNGKIIKKFPIESGIASVENDVITVITK